ncbi:HEAT repeat domain-containing protein [Calditrichota bacterium]
MRVTASGGFILKISKLLIILFAASILMEACSKKEPKYQRMPINVYLRRLSGEREATVDRAKTAIIAMGKDAVPFLLKDWRKKKTSLKKKYILADIFGGIGPSAEAAVPELIAALEIIDEEMVQHAAAALGGIGPASAAATPKLSSLLRSSDYSTQVGLLKGLGGIGPAASEAIPLMLEAAKREKTRSEAIAALGKMGPKVVDALGVWLESDNTTEKFIACEILANAGENAVAALPYLVKALNDKDARIRIAAVRAIGGTGPKAVGVMDELVMMLKDRESDVRSESISAIAGIGSNLAGDRMIAALNDPNPRIREGAIRVMIRWSSVLASAKSRLISRLGDSDVLVQLAATDGLTGIGPEVIPSMIKLLDSDNVMKRFGAARVLGNLGKAARSAVPKLKVAIKDKDSLVREEANKALQKIM